MAIPVLGLGALVNLIPIAGVLPPVEDGWSATHF